MVSEGATLRKLQILELKILLEFKRICERHNLQYFLIGGTLLGAVRHRGFVPWDDDIDVGMMRSEYIKFLNVCKDELSQEYTLQTFETDRTYAHPFAKIRLVGTEYPEPKYKAVSDQRGIWMDIFPFDSTPSNRLLRDIHRFRLMTIIHMCEIKYNYTVEPSTLLRRVLYLGLRWFSRPFSRTWLENRREYLFQKYNRENPGSYIYSTLCCFPSEAFEQFVELEFEGIKFPVPAGYTDCLTCAFGDYMSIPPENKRIRHTPHAPNFGKYADICSVDEIRD